METEQEPLGYLLGEERCQSLANRMAFGKAFGLFPTRVEIFLTQDCNFICRYCQSIRYSAPVWENACLRRVLERGAHGGTRHVQWTGGEPTLHPELLSLVSFAQELGLQQSMSTNGAASPDLYVQLVESGMEWLFVSLDHLDGDTFDSWTGSKGRLPLVIANIRRLARLAASGVDCHVVINVMLTQKSVVSLLSDQASGLLAILDWCMASGASDFKFLPVSSTTIFSLFPSNEDREQFLRICAATVPKRYRFFHYRLDSLQRGGHGLHGRHHHFCRHFLDDRAFDSVGAYPCIIHLREGGQRIYRHDDDQAFIATRIAAFASGNRAEDPLCRNYCFDVYRDFSDRVTFLHDQKSQC